MGTDPVLYVALGVPGEAEHEVSLNLQLVDGLNSFMNLNKMFLKDVEEWKNVVYKTARCRSHINDDAYLTLLSSDAISC